MVARYLINSLVTMDTAARSARIAHGIYGRSLDLKVDWTTSVIELVTTGPNPTLVRA